MKGRGRRIQRRRRQDLASTLLCLAVAAGQAWLLYSTPSQLPRRRSREKLAVALVSTPQRKLPPTPAILAPPPDLAPRGSARASLVEARRARAKAKAKSKIAAKRSPSGDRAPASQPAEEDGTEGDETGDAEGQEPENARASAEQVEPEPEILVAAAGGRRNCAFDGPGAALDASKGKAPAQQARWPASLLAPFRTRPALAPYLGDLEVLGRVGPRALGTYRVALPEDVIRVELEDPAGAALYVGRTDARCVVLATIVRDPMQLKLRAVPVRAVDRARRVAAAIVDIKMDDEARLVLSRRAGDKLPFTKARLANGGAVAATVSGHINMARLGR